VARYGGEEFIIVLSQVNSSDAYDIAEKLRKDVQALAITHQSTDVDNLEKKVVTISAGVASIIPSVSGRREKFFIKADKALYRAKEGGRNQCAL